MLLYVLEMEGFPYDMGPRRLGWTERIKNAKWTALETRCHDIQWVSDVDSEFNKNNFT